MIGLLNSVNISHFQLIEEACQETRRKRNFDAGTWGQ